MRIQWPYWLQSHKRVSKDKTNRIFDFFLKTYWNSPSLLILFPCQICLTLLIKGLFPSSFSWWHFIFFYGKWLMISVSNNTWFRLHVCTCKSTETTCAFSVDCGRCWKPNYVTWNSGRISLKISAQFHSDWKECIGRESQLISQCFQVCQELSFCLPPGP